MEVRIILISVVCLCLLTSPTLASLLLAKALAAKKAKLIGAGVAKGAVVAISVKKALASLALKAAVAKGNLILKGVTVAIGAKKALAGLVLKAAVHKGALLANVVKGAVKAKGALLNIAAAKVGAVVKGKSALLGTVPKKITTIFDIISGALCTGQKCVQNKKQILGNVINGGTAPQRILPGPPVLHEDVNRPRMYFEAVPVTDELEFYSK